MDVAIGWPALASRARLTGVHSLAAKQEHQQQ